MVEFGLKLSDNKVADWSDYYIEYDKLKAILKRVGFTLKRLQELIERKPVEAARIIEDYRNGRGRTTPSVSPSVSPNESTHSLLAQRPAQASLHNIVEEYNDKKEYGSFDSAATVEATEETPLSRPNTNYGEGTAETTSGRDERGIRKVDSNGNLIRRALSTAASSVSDYFQKTFDRTIRETLDEIEKLADEFEKLLFDNIERVNTFYNERLHELEERVVYLRESVLHLRGVDSSDLVNETIAMESPLVSHNRKRTKGRMALATQAVRRFSLNVIRHEPSLPHTASERWPSTILHSSGSDGTINEKLVDPNTIREADSIQRALVDHYRTAKLLHNFAIMNYTGFVKIVKKFNKTLSDRKDQYKHVIQSEKICNEGKSVEALADEMEILYANWFCDRNVSEARVQMLTKRGDGLEMDWSQLRLGFRMGMCSIVGLWVCWDSIWGLVSKGNSTIGGRTAFPVFRACAGLLLLQWCWGFSVWVWTRYRVNYIYLFDFNPSIIKSPLAIFNEAVDNTLVFTIFTLLYYKAGAHEIPGSLPAGIFPFSLVVYTVVQLVFPIQTRAPMWHAIWEVITAPMTSPSFFHGYVGDIFTSLVKVFQDLAWTTFFVFSGDWLISEDLKASRKHRWSKSIWYTNGLIPLLTLLPLWIRFNQCLRRYIDTRNRFPHLANAFKYALSQTVTLFGAFHPLYMESKLEADVFEVFWTLAFVASSLYSFWWDLYQDWGLGRLEYQMLGPRLMYPKRAIYYCIIGIDFVLRFAWVLTLVPPKSGAKFALPAYLTLVSMMLEIFRRTIWGFIRLENEHRSNTAGFRRVDFVPLHFSTGHSHDYKKGEARRGSTVLFEVAVVTILVLAAAVASVVAAQHATESRSHTMENDL